MQLENIGRYRVVGELGSGGFASVYLAEDPSLDTQVAVKVLAERLATDGDIRSRFIDEARYMRRLAAPGLVTVHDIGEMDGLPYFVMEYCERGTLADRLEELGRTVTIEEGLQLARAVAAGVDVVHRAGVVHRDLKPTNFMIRRVDLDTRTVIGGVLRHDEELVIGDFGLAKIVDVDASRMTLAGGTPGYGAPEQFLGDGSVDATADVYAASATLVAAISGTNPNSSINATEDVFPAEAIATTGPLAAELVQGLSAEKGHRQQDIKTWYVSLDKAYKTGQNASAETLLTNDNADPAPATANELGIEHLSDIRVIGEGGFSIVYGARHTLLNQPVAVKMLSRQLRDADRRRFERECEVMGRMSSQTNVVTIYNAGYNNQQTPYVMMELVEGGTIADLLEQQGPLPWNKAVQLITPIATALGEAHRQGILHRDIKPENILLDGDIPKLTDFGIASLRDATGSTSTHMTASWLHTAPETFENNRDERSDIYSLASTLFQLIAGQAPFWNPNDESLSPLMKRLISDPPPRLDPNHIPNGVNEFFALALAKDPDQRPQTARDFIAFVNAIGMTSNRAAHVSAPDSPPTVISTQPPITDQNGGHQSRMGPPDTDERSNQTGNSQRRQAASSQPIRDPQPLSASRVRIDQPIVKPYPSRSKTGGLQPTANYRKRHTLRTIATALSVLALLSAGAIAMSRLATGDWPIPAESSDGTSGTNESDTDGSPDEGGQDVEPIANNEATEGPEVTEVPEDTGSALPVVPDVVGLSQAAAEAELQGLKIGVTVENESSDAVAEGNVIKTTPAANSEATEVTLTISTGSALPVVPDVVGLSQAAAEAELQGLKIGVTVENESSDAVAEGNVIKTTPAANSEATEVTLTISTGSALPVVPDVVGLSQAAAEAELQGLKIGVTVENESSDAVAEGNVIKTTPAANSEATEVTLTISTGPDLTLKLGVELVEVTGNASGACIVRVDVRNDGNHPASGFSIIADIDWNEGEFAYSPRDLGLSGPKQIEPGQTASYTISLGSFGLPTRVLILRGSIVADGSTLESFSLDNTPIC